MSRPGTDARERVDPRNGPTSRSATKQGYGDENDMAPDTNKKSEIRPFLFSLGGDVVIAVIIMAIIICSLWAYTGNWPPMVVIESNSMMHRSDSSIGTIDTGDLVLVKSISDHDDVITYVEGKKDGYKTYGSYGDVIIFRKNGLGDTPVIHRAVVWIEYNASGHHVIEGNAGKIYTNGSFDVPSLGKYDVMEFWIEDYVPNHFNLSVNLYAVMNNFKNSPGVRRHGGFITKGGKNTRVDQESLQDSTGRIVEPIKTGWVVGNAVGELPWFGLIKLYIGGETDDKDSTPPPTSVNMLILSIVLIVAIPIILDVLFSQLSKHKAKKKEERMRRERMAGLDHERRPPRAGGPQPPKQPPPQSPPNAQAIAPPVAKPIEKSEPDTKSQSLSKDDLLRKIK